MKVCKYCNSECDDTEKICHSCGASEFSNKCRNCGTVFNSGFCPNCGVKVGQKPQTCPKCGNEYYTNACPYCGYNGLGQNTHQTINVFQTAPQTYKTKPAPASKKKTTVWTVLLWIIFLPIMAVIAIWKSNKLDKKWKIILTVVIAALCAVIAATNENASTWATTPTPISEFTYKIEDNGIVIEDYDGSARNVYVASSYSVDGKEMPVTYLDGTFALKSVSSVIIADGVGGLSANCFNSSGIKRLYIPKSVKSVDDAFWSYFHDLNTIHYGGNEADWKKLCPNGIQDGQVQIVYNSSINSLMSEAETTTK